MTVARDDWLSRIFGHEVYRATLADGSFEDLQAAVNSLVGQGRRTFLFSRVPSYCVDQVGALEVLGFRVVDVNVTSELRMSSGSVACKKAGVEVRLVEPRYYDDTLRIAATCFRYSRFHLDPLVPDATADEVKRAWVSSYIEGRRGEALWLALEDDRPVGFVAVLANETAGERRIVIDLIGVDADWQGRGVGGQLITHVIQTYADECDSIAVGTQVANIPSMRLYQRSGFEVTDTSYIMHLLSEGEGS